MKIKIMQYKDKVLKLHKEGYSGYRIAKMLGISVVASYYHISPKIREQHRKNALKSSQKNRKKLSTKKIKKKID